MLLAEAVGASGRVVGFDREARAIELARTRATAAGFGNIEFVTTSDDALPEHPPFDAVFGRYVLIHQADPVAMLRRAAAAARPGGIVAFHEVALHLDSYTRPEVELHRAMDHPLNSSFRALLPHHDVGGRLVECFAAAGLPAPHLIWESIAGDHSSPMWRWFAMSYFSMLPHVVRLGLGPVAEKNIDTVACKLMAEAARLRSQIVSRPQACGWTRRQ
jgi:SAM-dependent methyltransferase